jgi:hypothetical protein
VRQPSLTATIGWTSPCLKSWGPFHLVHMVRLQSNPARWVRYTARSCATACETRHGLVSQVAPTSYIWACLSVEPAIGGLQATLLCVDNLLSSAW